MRRRETDGAITLAVLENKAISAGLVTRGPACQSGLELDRTPRTTIPEPEFVHVQPAELRLLRGSVGRTRDPLSRCVRSYIVKTMAKEESPAAALARMRWEKTPPEERSKIARDLARARWGPKKEPPKPTKRSKT